MHLVEYLFALALHLHTKLLADGRKLASNDIKGLRRALHVGNHHHVEVILDNRLRNVEDVYAAVGKVRTGLRENPDGVLADYGYDHFIHGGQAFLSRDDREGFRARGIHHTCAQADATP